MHDTPSVPQAYVTRARARDRVCACAPTRIKAEIGAVGMERVARARHERGPREAPATRGAGGYGAIHSRGRQERPTTIGRTREERDVCGSRFRAATRAFPSRREMSNRESSGDCSPPKALSTRHMKPDLLLSLLRTACFFPLRAI